MDLGSGTLLSAIIALVLGAVLCFLGYRIFKSFVMVYGFIIGAGLGAALARQIAPDSTLIMVLAALIAGLIGAVLLRFLYWLAIFIIGAAAGAVLAQVIGSMFGQTTPLLLVIVAAVIVGVLAVVFQRLAIILITAFSGAWAAVSGVVSPLTGQAISLTGAFTLPDVELASGTQVIVLVAWLVLGIVGAVYQFRTGEPGARWR